MVSTLLTLVVIPLKCATIDPKKVYGCATGAQAINAAVAGAPTVAVTDVGIALAAPSAEKKDWSEGKIRLLWVIPAMIGIFAWTAVTTLVGWIGRWKWVKKLLPILTMAGYALRALPYFVMLFVKDTYTHWRESRAQSAEPAPTPAPAPAPAPVPTPVPASAPQVQPKPKQEAEVVKATPEVKTEPVQKAPAKKKTPAQKTPTQKAPTQKTPTKKSVAKKAPAKKTAAKKTPTAKPVAQPKARPKAKRRGIRLKTAENGPSPEHKKTPAKDQGDET